MAKPTEPNIEFPQAFAIDGQKTDFLEEKIQNGFDPIDPDVLAGDNLNKFIDDTYKGLHYSIDAVNDLYKGAVLYSPTETYNSKSIVFNIGEDGIALYRSLTDNNLGNPLTDIEKWQAVDLGGSSSSGSGLSMFDLVVKDHILSYEESKGLALQGTYVYKDAVPGSRYGYPDFYNRCVEEFENSTPENVYIGNKDILLPVFTANTTDGITVSDSRGAADVYTLINGVSYRQIGNWNSYWFNIDYARPTIINSYTIQADSNGSPEYPSAWTLQGTNDGSSWDVLDTQTGQSFALGQSKNFEISTDKTYSQYRIVFSAGALQNGNGELGRLGFNVEKLSDFQIYRNPNGHIFYDIKDKEAVDEWFDKYGIADFYGVDKENERIFLPRNRKFFQFTTETAKVNDMVEAGLPNIEGTMFSDISEGSATGALKITNTYNGSMWSGSTSVPRMRNWSFDASLSNPIYGKSDTVQPPSSLKLLYYVVGNTDVQSAATDIVDVTTTENDTLPLFYNFYAKDEDMADAVSFVKSTSTFLSGNLYPTAYNKLVARVGTGNVKTHTDDYTDYDFVVNQDEMTFRLPLKNGKETMFSTACKGNGMTLGLTDGSNNAGMMVSSTTNGFLQLASDAYGQPFGTAKVQAITGHNNYGITPDPTKSGIVPHIEIPEGYGLYYKLLNAVVNQELVDFAHIQTELNTKLSRSNKEEIVSWGMPDYTAGIDVGTAYNVLKDGYIGMGAVAPGGSTYTANITINDTGFEWKLSYANIFSPVYPVCKGDVVKLTGSATLKLVFFPLKGANQ